MPASVSLLETSAELADAGREFYRRGWALGTSGNYSAVLSRDPLRICITASGVDKSRIDETNFLELDGYAEILQGFGKPSAETRLHLSLYRLRSDAGSVMHTHSVWGTILSEEFFADRVIKIEGYEMLKGLAGVTNHEHTELVPVIENSQDYTALAHVLENALREYPDAHGIYLRRHGLYAWGTDLAEAKRHIEIFEFLFEVLARSQTHLR